MSRKHFIAIADALRKSKANIFIVRAVIEALKETNPRFDEDTFRNRAYGISND